MLGLTFIEDGQEQAFLRSEFTEVNGRQPASIF